MLRRTEIRVKAARRWTPVFQRLTLVVCGAAKVKELTARLEREMEHFGDTAALSIANPRPAEWKPPTAGRPKVPRKKRTTT